MAPTECRPDQETSTLLNLFFPLNCPRRLLESTDPEFDDWHKQFQGIEAGTEKLIKDTKAFTEAVTSMSSRVCLRADKADHSFPSPNISNLIWDARCLSITALFTAGSSWATHYATVFEPMAGEYDLIGKHPDSVRTVRNATKYSGHMEELRALIAPELELIQTRVSEPVKEFQTIVKTIRKTIVKRDHKVPLLAKVQEVVPLTVAVSLLTTTASTTPSLSSGTRRKDL